MVAKEKKDRNLLELDIDSDRSFLNQNTWKRRFNLLKRSSAEWAARVSAKPLINTLTVETMVTNRQNLQFLTIFERTQANTTLCFLQRAIRVRRSLVQDYGQFLNGIRVQALRRRRRRVASVAGIEAGWEWALIAADPASVEEEESNEEDNGEKDDDEE